MTTVYKIVAADLWQAAEDSGVFTGAGIDLNDGFIHLSTGAQARRTAQLYFAGQDNLVLVAVDEASLGDALKYEPSRDGDLFPHLYGSLPLTAVLLGAAAASRCRWQSHLSGRRRLRRRPAAGAPDRNSVRRTAAQRESVCMLRPGSTTRRVAQGSKAARSQ